MQDPSGAKHNTYVKLHNLNTYLIILINFIMIVFSCPELFFFFSNVLGFLSLSTCRAFC